MWIAHDAIISSLEDASTVLYQGCAKASDLEDDRPMMDDMTQPDQWRDRLAAAIDERGFNPRSVSLGAGLSPGYVHGILKEKKDPKVVSLLRVCEFIGVSIVYIITGLNISPETEKILVRLENDPDGLAAIDELLKRR